MQRRTLIAGGILAAVVIAVVGIRLGGNQVAKTGLDRALAALPPGWTATHGPVAYAALTGSATVHDFTLQHDRVRVFSAESVEASGLGGDSSPDGAPKRIGHVTVLGASGGYYRRVERIELSGVALANLRDVLDPEAYPAGRPAWTDMRPLIDHVEVFNTDILVAGDKPLNLQVTHAENADYAGHPFPLAPTAENRTLPAFWPGVASAFTQGRGSVEGVSGSLPDGRFALASETVSGYAAGRVGNAEMVDLDVASTPPNGNPSSTFKMARMTIRDIDFSRMLAHLPELIADPSHPHPDAMQGMRVGQYKLENISFAGPNLPAVTMADADVQTEWAANDASSSKGGLHTIVVDTRTAANNAGTRENLKRFGMDVFTTDIDITGTYDPHTTRATIDRYDIALHDLGTLHITGAASGFTGSPNDPAAMQQMMSHLVLEHAAIRWDDASLTRRLFDVAAFQAHTTPAALRAKLAIPLATLGVMLPDQPDAGDQVGAFLNGQHSLAITMTPARPVSLGDVMAAPVQEKAHLLGTKISGS